jgi:glutamate racemase
MNNLPIGFIDSGVGGLTVVKEVMKLLPDEEILFVGDSSRNPYGPLPLDVVNQYARQMAAFLVQKGIKLLVIACNTATVSSLDILQKELDIPVIGVIEAGSKAAAALTQNNEVGIIATEATVDSCEYEFKIKSFNHEAVIYSKAVPEFVKLVENNHINNSETENVISKALTEFKDTTIDTFVLGCTHYPLLQSAIQNYFGERITIVNPAINTAQQVEELLREHNLFKDSNTQKQRHTFYTSGSTELFNNIALQWLEQDNFEVEYLPVEELNTYAK